MLENRRIFYAEDDVDDRFFFGQALSNLTLRHNYTIEFVEDGLELLDLLEQADQLPDIIFLDLNLPKKNGTDCLRDIRAIKRYDLIPVVVLSTSRSESNIQLTFDLGANLYLCKPGDFDRLVDVLQVCFDRTASIGLFDLRNDFLIDGQ